MAKTPWTEDKPSRTWSPQQLAVFTWFAAAVGHLVVRARAGTGKTTTILEAVKYIPDKLGWPTTKIPPRILLAAFNKRIQTELADKLSDERAEAKTLHALGYQFLRKAWSNARVDDAVEDERIAAVVGAVSGEVASVIKRLVSLLKGSAPFCGPEKAAEIAMDRGCIVENGQANEWPVERLAEVACKVRDQAKTKDVQGRITFDDMLFIPVVLKLVHAVYDWVIVDEAQDMNVTQLLLAQAACKRDGHVVVVGDDCQAIYGFRGADSGSIDRLKRELGATELSLTTTYRCPKSVVSMAQKLVGDYEAAPTAPEGFVASLPVVGLPEWCGPGDAILSRVNAPLVSLCLGFIRRGTAARIEGRDIGKTLAATIKKLHARSIPEFLAALRAYNEKWTARILAKGKNVDARLGELADKVETLSALAEGCKGMPELLARCDSMFGDSNGARTNAVVLSSVHKAKGLEWTKVFLLEKTLYCGGRRVDQEERNIHYVAVTRAKESLVMVQEV